MNRSMKRSMNRSRASHDHFMGHTSIKGSRYNGGASIKGLRYNEGASIKGLRYNEGALFQSMIKKKYIVLNF